MFYSFHSLPVFIYAGFAYQSHCFCLYLPPVFECFMFLCCNSFIPLHCLVIKDKFLQWGTNRDPMTWTSRGGSGWHILFRFCHRWWKGFPNKGKLFLLFFFFFFFLEVIGHLKGFFRLYRKMNVMPCKTRGVNLRAFTQFGRSSLVQSWGKEAGALWMRISFCEIR